MIRWYLQVNKCLKLFPNYSNNKLVYFEINLVNEWCVNLSKQSLIRSGSAPMAMDEFNKG